MSKIDDLIEKLCPNGVEYKPIWSLTAWDKKFNGVDKEKQKNVISYKYYLSTDFAKVEKKNGNIKYISTGISGDDRYTTEELAGDYLAEGEVVCIPWGGTPNVKYHKGKFVTGDNRIATSLDINILSNKFLYYWMQSKINVISKFYRGSGIKHPSMKDVLDMNIAVPPLEVQCEIVHILDDFTLLSALLSAELKARQKQYEYYRNEMLKCSDNTKLVKFGDVAKIQRGASPRPISQFITDDENGVNWIKIGDVEEGKKYITQCKEKITIEGSRKSRLVKKGDFILSNSMSFGRPYILSIDGCIHDGWLSISDFQNYYLPDFLYHLLNSNDIQNMFKQKASFGGAVQNLNADIVRNIELPLISLEQQQKIIKVLDKFEIYCNDISEGLPAEIEARQKQYEYYRDKLLTFKELKVNE